MGEQEERELASAVVYLINIAEKAAPGLQKFSHWTTARETLFSNQAVKNGLTAIGEFSNYAKYMRRENEQ